MVKLNTKATGSPSYSLEQVTTNEEGAKAFKLSAKDRLIERTLGAFWNEDLFYAKGSTVSAELLKDINAVSASEPKFVLQLAAFARNVMYLRTTPQVLLVHAANIEASKPYVRKYTPLIVKRADELSEVIAYQLGAFGKPIPNALKKGLADAFTHFDEYQLNKYDSDKKDVSLGDVLRLIARHEGYPVSKAMRNFLLNDEVDAEALPKIAAFKKLMSKSSLDDEALELIKTSHVTWESLISKFGSTKETWDLVIPNMGYMARLRNLRNFEQKGINIAPVLDYIKNPEQVKRSKQLPFRFYSAYKNTSEQKTKRAIAQAFEASIENVNLSGKTAIFIDLSGSMESKLSDKSSVSYKEVAAVLAAIAIKKAEDSIVIGFADVAGEFGFNPDDTMITNINGIIGQRVGSSTNAWLAFETLGNRKVDRIILISDMQCYDSTGNKNYNPGYGWGYNGSTPQSVYDKWEAYRKQNRGAYLYSLDISAYGTKQAPTANNNAVSIFGWSDKVLDYIAFNESKASLTSEIAKW